MKIMVLAPTQWVVRGCTSPADGSVSGWYAHIPINFFLHNQKSSMFSLTYHVSLLYNHFLTLTGVW